MPRPALLFEYLSLNDHCTPDFVLRLFQCEQGKSSYAWDLALDILGALGLGFSCLFMVELIASIWAFGYGYVLSSAHLNGTPTTRRFLVT